MKQVFFITAITLLISCGNKAKQKDPNPTDSTNTGSTTVESNYSTDSLTGEYIGGFGNSTIIVSITYINGNRASGYNILKGNRRNIKGEVLNKGAFFEFNLTEPGGEPTDGDFKFTIDTATKTMEGIWIPLDTIKLKSKKYKLTRRKYAHEDIKGFVGMWYLNGLTVEFKADKTGLAEGLLWNEKTETDENVKIPFSWFEEKKSVSIEWSKNNIFLSPVMKFKYEKNEYEEMLQSGDYIMYRY